LKLEFLSICHAKRETKVKQIPMSCTLLSKIIVLVKVVTLL